MKRRGTIMRTLCGAGVIVLVALISTGPGLANHTNLGLLFVSSTFGVPGGELVSIDIPAGSQVQRASGLLSAEGIACGPDGKVYVTQTGIFNAPGPRRIVRFSQTGTGAFELVLDFATTPALASSGGPEGPSFGLVAQDDGRLVPSGELFFNTRAVGGFSHTGVWKLPAVGATPVQVILPFAGAGGNGEATAFLTTGSFAGHLLAVDFPGGRVLRRAPPFTGPVAGINFINGLSGPNGLAIDNVGDVYVAESFTKDIEKFTNTGSSLGLFVNTGQVQRKIGFDAAGNLYVATTLGPVLHYTPPSTSQSTVGSGVPGGNGVAVCPQRIPALIDIKPGSFPNPINIKSNGVIPVAILSTPYFDATTIDQGTANIKFGPTGTEASPVRPCVPEDVNADGRLDLVCHFRQKEAGFSLGSTTGVVRWGNQDFEGLAAVVTGDAPGE